MSILLLLIHPEVCGIGLVGKKTYDIYIDGKKKEKGSVNKIQRKLSNWLENKLISSYGANKDRIIKNYSIQQTKKGCEDIRYNNYNNYMSKDNRQKLLLGRFEEQREEIPVSRQGK